MILNPESTFSPYSSITRWSAVIYGSHSHPFRITVSIFLSLGGTSLTWVGKVAPPSPTMPASLIFSKSFFTESAFGFLATSSSTHLSSPSEVTVKAFINRPVGGFITMGVPDISPDTEA